MVAEYTVRKKPGAVGFSVVVSAFRGVFAILKAMGMVSKLRVSPKEEKERLDAAELSPLTN